MIVEYQNRLAVPANILYEDLNLCSYSKYLKDCDRGKLVRLKTGKGKGNHAIIDLESMPSEFKKVIYATFPNPKKVAETNAFSEFITEDTEAVAFFNNYRTAAGKGLKAKHITRHCNEAAILNGFKRKIEGILKHTSRGATTRGFWTKAVNVLDGLQTQWPHKLPNTEKRLKEKYERYQQHGCRSLLKGWDNQNSRVVNAEIELLLNSIYCQYFKPNHVQVLNDYQAFLDGKKELVNKITGEIFDRTEYEPVSESTVRNYLTKWQNQVVTHSRRSNNRIQFGAKNRAYASLVTDFAGSILSLDDRDLPWKLHNGKRAIAYIAADVASECFVGWAFSKPAQREDDQVYGKNLRLVNNMFQNLFQQLAFYGVNMPAELEVENHLMSSLKETALKEGNLFRYVRFAAAENPQEKKIEGMFRRLRYYYDKRQNNGLGWLPRPSARDEANQARMEDAIKHTYDFEAIVQMATDSMMQWNADLHPNQKKYPGMSRLDVWMDRQHTELMPIQWQKVARYIGNKTETSVNRYEIRCNNQIWRLPSAELANKTGNNGQAIDAYWLTDQEGNTDKLYLYAKDSEEFLCEALPKPVAHKARIEQTEDDKKILGKNYRYNKGIEQHIKEGKEKLVPLAVMNTENTTLNNHQVEIIADEPEELDYFKLQNSSTEHNLLDEL